MIDEICAKPEMFERSVNENIRCNGERVWIDWTNRVVLDRQGRVTEILSIGSDITEVRQLEQERAINEERFRSLMEHTEEGFYLFETVETVSVDLPVEEQIRRIYRGSIVECNDAQARMYGYEKAAEVIGKTLADFHGSTDNQENIAFLTAWIESGYNISGAVARPVDPGVLLLFVPKCCVGMGLDSPV